MNLPRPVGARTSLPVFALDAEHLLRRTLEVIPGALTWGTLIGLAVLAFRAPLPIALFIIVYDLYWVTRALYVGSHLIASYQILRRMSGIAWLDRLRLLEDPPAARAITDARIRDIERLLKTADRQSRKRLSKTLQQERTFAKDIRNVPTDPTIPLGVPLGFSSKIRRAGVPNESLRDSAGFPRGAPLTWRDILHVVILPSFREPLEVLEQSLDGIAASNYPKERLWVVVALEERAGAHARGIQQALEQRYASTFGRFLTTLHPDGVLGERQVKSANATYAARQVKSLLDAEGIPYERVIVSNLDADTVVSTEYFGSLTYAYLVTPDRLRCSFQPLPFYHNNIWHAPAFTRVIATNSTFWLLIRSASPERLVTFSSHAMPFKALVDVGFWDPTVVSEDSRIFWQCYLHYHGQYRTVPLYTTVSMDVTCSRSLWQTFKSQYKQKRRWAWGIENFPYIARAFLRRSPIPVRDRFRYSLIMLEGWHSWSTASLILAVLGWIPILTGGPDFQQTILAFNLPRVSSTLLSLSTVGLLANIVLSLALLPPAPPGTPKRKYLWMILQWVLVPPIAWTLGTPPALDAVTRLMLGKHLGFWVTPKVRAGAPIIAARSTVLAPVRSQ